MDFTAVHMHFHDLQPFCNSMKISNHNDKKQQKMSIQMIIIILFQSDYWLPVPNYNTLWEARDWLGMPGGGGGGGGIRGSGGRGSGPHRKITRCMGRSRSI